MTEEQALRSSGMIRSIIDNIQTVMSYCTSTRTHSIIPSLRQNPIASLQDHAEKIDVFSVSLWSC